MGNPRVLFSVDELLEQVLVISLLIEKACVLCDISEIVLIEIWLRSIQDIPVGLSWLKKWLLGIPQTFCFLGSLLRLEEFQLLIRKLDEPSHIPDRGISVRLFTCPWLVRSASLLVGIASPLVCLPLL